MYIEKNISVLQQLFAGENIYFLKDEFVEVGLGDPVNTDHPKVNTETVSQATKSPLISAQPTPEYYQPQQKVIIVLNKLNQADGELLGKILGAVKLDLSSVDIIEVAQSKAVDLSQIFVQKSVNQVVVFGINLSELNLEVALIPYQIFEKQGIKFIYSESLSDIQNDIPKKKALWGSLKEMF